MHPTIIYHLATARSAELRSQAQRDALARAARHARTHKLEHAAPRLVAAGRRLLTSLRPRGRWRGGDAGGWSGAQVLVPPSAECRLSAGGTTEPEDQSHGVVLPAPLGPRNPVTRPDLTVKLRPSTASVAPYRLVRPRASIIWPALADTEPAQPPVVLLVGQSLSPALTGSMPSSGQYPGRLERRPIVSPAISPVRMPYQEAALAPCCRPTRRIFRGVSR